MKNDELNNIFSYDMDLDSDYLGNDDADVSAASFSTDVVGVRKDDDDDWRCPKCNAKKNECVCHKVSKKEVAWLAFDIGVAFTGPISSVVLKKGSRLLSLVKVVTGWISVLDTGVSTASNLIIAYSKLIASARSDVRAQYNNNIDSGMDASEAAAYRSFAMDEIDIAESFGNTMSQYLSYYTSDDSISSSSASAKLSSTGSSLKSLLSRQASNIDNLSISLYEYGGRYLNLDDIEPSCSDDCECVEESCHCGTIGDEDCEGHTNPATPTRDGPVPMAVPVLLGALWFAYKIYSYAKIVRKIVEMVKRECECDDDCKPKPDDDGEPNVTDPLVVDLNNDGKIRTISVNSSNIYQDLNGDNLAHKIGWVAPEDGMIFYDENNNSKFDGMHELFGNSELNGFEELALHDNNNDGVINSDDEIYSKLQVWQDKNSDGVVQDGELYSFDELGLESINLEHTTVDIDNNGNKIIASGSYVIGGNTHYAGSVGLVYDSKGESVYIGDVEIDDISKDLPTLRGFGDVAISNVAYALDHEFRSYMDDLVKSVDERGIAAVGSFSADELLYHWSGLKKLHEDNGIKRERLSMGDKVWIFEKFNGKRKYSSDIENAYKNGTSDEKPFGNHLTLDTENNRQIYDRLASYYNDRAVAILFEKSGIDSIKYNYSKDDISVDYDKLRDQLLSIVDNSASFIMTVLKVGSLSFVGNDYLSIFFWGTAWEDFYSVDRLNNNFHYKDSFNKMSSKIIAGKDEDTFVYGRGDGAITIFDSGGDSDTLVFGEGITLNDS